VELNGPSGPLPPVRATLLYQVVLCDARLAAIADFPRRLDHARFSLFCCAVGERPGACAGEGDGGPVGPSSDTLNRRAFAIHQVIPVRRDRNPLHPNRAFGLAQVLAPGFPVVREVRAAACAPLHRRGGEWEISRATHPTAGPHGPAGRLGVALSFGRLSPQEMDAPGRCRPCPDGQARRRRRVGRGSCRPPASAFVPDTASATVARTARPAAVPMRSAASTAPRAAS
jgi:hypothetical protein